MLPTKYGCHIQGSKSKNREHWKDKEPVIRKEEHCKLFSESHSFLLYFLCKVFFLLCHLDLQRASSNISEVIWHSPFTFCSWSRKHLLFYLRGKKHKFIKIHFRQVNMNINIHIKSYNKEKQNFSSLNRDPWIPPNPSQDHRIMSLGTDLCLEGERQVAKIFPCISITSIVS